jgi:hypothetical protein
MRYQAPPKFLYLVRVDPGVTMAVRYSRKAADEYIAAALELEGQRYAHFSVIQYRQVDP